MVLRELSIDIQYEKHADGRYYIRSFDLPGFRLVGEDIDALTRDLEPIVKDLLRLNMGFDVESLRWVPSVEDAKRHLAGPSAGKATYVASLKAAA